MSNKNRWLVIGFITIGGLIIGGYIRLLNWEKWGINYDEAVNKEEIFQVQPNALMTEYLLLKNLLPDKKLTIQSLATDIFHAFPTYYILARQWVGNKSDNIWKDLRKFSLLWGILTIPAIGLLAFRFGLGTAILALLFALIHPVLHFYGTYIRFYSFFVFVTTIGYASAVWLLPWLSRKSETSIQQLTVLQWIAIAILSFLVVLPATIHLGGFIVSLSIFMLAFFYLQFSRLGLILYSIIILFILAPLLNAIAFFYARSIYTPPSLVMSESIIHAIGSWMFNFGVGITIAATIWVIVAGKRSLKMSKIRSDEKETILLALAVGVAVTCTLILIIIKNELFRPDYAAGLLPIVLTMAASGIIEMQHYWNNVVSRIFISVVSVGMIGSSLLPTFISNAFIDGDRVDYKKAIATIRVDTHGRYAIVASSSPSSMAANDQSGNDLEFIHFKTAQGKVEKGFPVYYVVREIKGFSTHRSMDLSNVPGHLLDVIGKDRLDHRRCMLYVFRVN